MKCPGSGAGERSYRASLSVTTCHETNQRGGHRYSCLTSSPERTIDYRDQIVLDYRAHSHIPTKVPRSSDGLVKVPSGLRVKALLSQAREQAQ